LEGRFVRPSKECKQRIGQQRVAGGGFEQSEAGPQLHRVELAENVGGHLFARPAADGFDALAVTVAEQPMGEIGSRLVQGPYSVELRGRAPAEIRKLRENEPDPVVPLSAILKLEQRNFEHAFLGIDEALELKRV
jgi:hypothetical protein